MSRPRLITVVGATGVGKTKLGVQLCRALGGEVVNTDSMQMYKGLDIATAKVTTQECQGVPHHLMNFLNPEDSYTVHGFRDQALNVVADIVHRKKFPVLVGGTLYYVQSMLWPSLIDETSTETAATTTSKPKNATTALASNMGSNENNETRARDEPASSGYTSATDTTAATTHNSGNASEVLNRMAREQAGGSVLYAQLKKVDPATAALLHPNDARKIERSLQIFAESGRPQSEHIAEQEATGIQSTLRYDCVVIWLTCDADEHWERLCKRVDVMMEQGLLDEARSFVNQHETLIFGDEEEGKFAKEPKQSSGNMNNNDGGNRNNNNESSNNSSNNNGNNINGNDNDNISNNYNNKNNNKGSNNNTTTNNNNSNNNTMPKGGNNTNKSREKSECTDMSNVDNTDNESVSSSSSGTALLGNLQAIGYKEFMPYFEAERRGDVKLASILATCVENLKVKHRQYAKSQTRWMHSRMLNRNAPVVQLDTSGCVGNENAWNTQVLEPALAIAREVIAGNAQDLPASLFESGVAKRANVSPIFTNEEKRQALSRVYVCEQCGGREVRGDLNWDVHLKSKRHRGAYSRMKKKEEFKRYLESKKEADKLAVTSSVLEGEGSSSLADGGGDDCKATKRPKIE